MLLVGYVRTSGDKQESTSLQSQRERIRAKAFADGHELLDILEDKESAEHASTRPGFQRALQYLREGKAEGIIVFKLDRFARSVLDGVTILQQFKESNKYLVCCADPIDTTTPMGQAFFQIAMVFAELERKTISQRCIQGRVVRGSQKRYAGGSPPYGWISVIENGHKRLVECPEERRVIEWAREARASGMRFVTICKILNEKNIPSKRGGKWYACNIRRIILERTAIELWMESGCSYDYLEWSRQRKQKAAGE